ncbi:MAG: VCBS repeat-containing protein [Saprospiraceae bacterium]|nr:VCBS repeat-containing protein [Saprospiraceae bacterium]
MYLLVPLPGKALAVLTVLVLLSEFAIAQPKWQVAKHTTDYQEWERLAVGSGFPVETFAFHDFDGDGKTDVFTAYRGAFQYSSGGRTGWRTLNTRFSDSNTHGNGVDWEDLRFGDIDGDRKTDVFFPWKGNFVYVSAGKGDAIILRKADVPIDHVFIGDFNGDRKAEIFYKPRR